MITPGWKRREGPFLDIPEEQRVRMAQAAIWGVKPPLAPNQLGMSMLEPAQPNQLGYQRAPMSLGSTITQGTRGFQVTPETPNRMTPAQEWRNEQAAASLNLASEFLRQPTSGAALQSGAQTGRMARVKIPTAMRKEVPNPRATESFADRLLAITGTRERPRRPTWWEIMFGLGGEEDQQQGSRYWSESRY